MGATADTETGSLAAEVLDLDRRHVWHPYAPMPLGDPPLPVQSANGATLRLMDGRELVDGMASWWCAIHGYRHPVIDAALREQLDSMSHVMFGGLTHEPAVRLATRLAAMTPNGLEHVFFADSGSVSVEVAIKLCLQYQRGRGRPERRRLLALRGGYHGDTFGAMAVCDPVTGMHSMFTGAVAEQVFADRPPGGFGAPVPGGYLAGLRRLVETHARELAAVIVEPVVQGAGGMWFYSPEVLRVLRTLCDEHELLLVFDEIATGFGRTGALFAAEHAGVCPDVMCVGKALTGGYLTLAAMLCTPAVSEAVAGGEGGALMHGPTFMANPLACAAALASLSVLEAGDWRGRVAAISRRLAAGLEPAREWPGVADVRTLGAIGVIELREPVELARATAAAVAQGVWLRPFGRLVYAMPPYVVSDQELDRIVAGMLAAARTCAGAGR